jgi:hypothetical protein
MQVVDQIFQATGTVAKGLNGGSEGRNLFFKRSVAGKFAIQQVVAHLKRQPELPAKAIQQGSFVGVQVSKQ